MTAMLPAPLVIGTSLAYLLLLVGVAYWADRRAAARRSVIARPWVYALSMAVYCTAWTYFGSVERAATGGMWFLPIYLGPTLAMVLGWTVLRKMIRIAKTHRITSIADFIASRYGKSQLLATLVTLVAVVGIVPYIALQLKAVSSGYALLTSGSAVAPAHLHWSQDSAFYVAIALAGFAIVFGARHLDTTERHEGMVAAIAFESLVKLAAFLCVGVFVVYGLFGGLGDIFSQARARPELADLLHAEQGGAYSWARWMGLMVLALCAALVLPRQFQVMVVENVHEDHVRRASWMFPLYLLLINLFVLPIALGGLLYFSGGEHNPEHFVLSLPMAAGQNALALFVFIGGLSAATGMVIVETVAVSTMVSNELALPLLLRLRLLGTAHQPRDFTRSLLMIRRAAIVGVLLLGYLYFQLAGDAYALASIGLISFAAVAQFAPVLLGGMYWRGGTRAGALAGLIMGFGVWVYTLMLPSIAKSGWLDVGFLTAGPWGVAWLRPESLWGLQGLDSLTHSLFWSLLTNCAAYVIVSLWRAPSGREASQALLFVDVFRRGTAQTPVFWRGRADAAELKRLCERFLGVEKTRELWRSYAKEAGLIADQALVPDARLVQFVEAQLTGAVGSASARVLVASVSDEEALSQGDVLVMLEEASQLRSYSRALETKSRSLEQATSELRSANEQLKSLDRLKDDFMSSVTHELRTPLTSIRALAEILQGDAEVPPQQRQRFVDIIVQETERLTRLVNQVLDMAKIESGHIDWRLADIDVRALLEKAMATTAALLSDRGAEMELDVPQTLPLLHADPDRLLQVLLNLISNAAKFVPPQGGHVQLRARADGQGLTVCVQDNGPGVPAGHEHLIFDRFHQAGGPTPGGQGTGLGLPISHHIVAHFGGRLWLEPPAPGAPPGACFCFWLPWQPAFSGDTAP
ncbi:MAG: sensor histidine kinase [Giesbergeria sp.]|jgi:Na+/proline symporter/nitrogen-specific signal transduction histidine kinase